MQRLLSSPAIQFKGSGWYITDYAKKASSDSPAAQPSDAKTTGDAKGATETTSETASKTDSSKTDSSSSSTPAPAASSKK